MSKVPDLSTADDKLAKLALRLKADSGFSSACDYRVSANQWAQIIAICEDGEQRVKMTAAPDLLAALERLTDAVVTRTLRGRDHVPSMREEQDAAHSARLAIAKATPEALAPHPVCGGESDAR